jgi:hypothetical protein
VSRLDCSADDRLVKGETLVQHVELPVVQLCVGSSLRTGVTEAVTPLAKAMAATREMSGLENRIVKNV